MQAAARVWGGAPETSLDFHMLNQGGTRRLVPPWLNLKDGRYSKHNSASLALYTERNVGGVQGKVPYIQVLCLVMKDITNDI